MLCRCTEQRPLSLVCLRQEGPTNGSWLLSLEAVRTLKETQKGLRGSRESSNCLIGMYNTFSLSYKKCILLLETILMIMSYFVSDWIHWSLDSRHSCLCVDAMTLCTGRTITSSTCFFRQCHSSSVGLAGLGLMSRSCVLVTYSMFDGQKRRILIFCKNKDNFHMKITEKIDREMVLRR